jgi:hypothetical protein
MRQRPQWRQILALLLAVVLATVGTAPPGAAHRTASVQHEAALAAHQDGATPLARSPIRVLDARTFGGVDIALPPPNAVRPLRLAIDSRSAHGDPSPRTRRAPSTGDRAPPSH